MPVLADSSPARLSLRFPDQGDGPQAAGLRAGGHRHRAASTRRTSIRRRSRCAPAARAATSASPASCAPLRASSSTRSTRSSATTPRGDGAVTLVVDGHRRQAARPRRLRADAGRRCAHSRARATRRRRTSSGCSSTRRSTRSARARTPVDGRRTASRWCAADRGGEITYHGPGQVVLYTLVDLARRGIKVKRFVALLEQAVIDLLGRHARERSPARPASMSTAPRSPRSASAWRAAARTTASRSTSTWTSRPFPPSIRAAIPGLPVTQTRDARHRAARRRDRRAAGARSLDRARLDA